MIGAAFPVDDWQFWVVTLAALGALAFIVWRSLGKRLLRKRSKGGSKAAPLTVEGKPVGKG